MRFPPARPGQRTDIWHRPLSFAILANLLLTNQLQQSHMPIRGHFLPAASNGDKRHEVRRKLSLLARGVQHDGTGIEVQIHNISGPGLLFESDIKLRSEEHTSELPSLMRISYAVFCLQITIIISFH